MEDHKVSFETAKLAKEKGFDELVLMEQPRDWGGPTYAMYRNSEYKEHEGSWGIKVTRPTQSLLQTWLRRNKGIDIVIHVYQDKDKDPHYEWSAYCDCFDEEDETEQERFDGYEEALEDALFKCLKTL